MKVGVLSSSMASPTPNLHQNHDAQIALAPRARQIRYRPGHALAQIFQERVGLIRRQPNPRAGSQTDRGHLDDRACRLPYSPTSEARSV